MQYFFRFAIAIFFISSSATVFAQEKTISGNFEDVKFPVFVQQAEQRGGIYFYYDEEQLDTFTLHLTLTEATLKHALELIFANTAFHFVSDSAGHIFITDKNPLHLSLASNFFTPDAVVADEDSDTLEKKIVKPKAFIENKLYTIGAKSTQKKGNISLTGFIKESKNGEALSGASIFLDNKFTGVVTDQFGYYSLVLTPGSHTLEVTSVGMKDTRRNLLVYSDGKLNVDMQDFVASLKNVSVTAERNSTIKNTQLGVDRISVKTIKTVPVVFGEPDILRVVLTLPGVTSVGEASTGFNVRGGAADQNLVLFDDATIYNPSHLLGFFSAFNTDVVRSVELYKSVIPVQYGGRLSSVLEVNTKDGNDKKLSGTAGIGPLTSRITLEGPIKKEKTSFVAGARTTYSNWILKAVPDEAYSSSKASFYDANIHISHTINAKNNLYLTGYISNDKFRFGPDTTYKYGNKNVILKWKHNFNNRFSGIAAAGIDNYDYNVTSTFNPVNSYELGYAINQRHLKIDFTYRQNNKQTLNFGVSSIYYSLHPGSLLPSGTQSLVKENTLAKEQAVETAAYAGYQYSISSSFSVNAGIRYSMFNYLGAHNSFEYVSGLPRQVETIKDTIAYASGKNIKTYQAPEYRISLRYALSENTSLKLGYNTLRQYIHQLSNTISISPTDIWKLSDEYIKPEISQQYSFGIYQNFNSNNIETSLEVYYKTLENLLDYKSGAVVLLNPHIETDVLNSKGKAYGAEFLIKKLNGKLNGWLSYTYSRTMIKTDDPQGGEVINRGTYYPTSYDKPNAVNLVSNYKFSHRLNMSVNVVYSTGRPITLPVGVFFSNGAQRLVYSDRNAYRIPDYFRSDISFNLDGNHKIHQLLHSSWSLGVYNLTFRKNVYSAYFVSENGRVKGYQLSIFGSAIPFVSYNIRF